MTAAVYRKTQPSLSVPHTQNTAPVLEFNCLYTHDIRRKQKRWQDGFLRFHTFNKRVMVYDVPRNFIGDTHWKADEAVQDGDEVTLEKDGVLVQVAESVGRTETDLTELRRSKKNGSSEHGSSPAKGGLTPAVSRASGMSQNQGTQLKHRSLNALLGTPKGPLGKAALPAKSPYEERRDNAENEGWENGRPRKRRRVEHPQGWNITRTTKTPVAAHAEKTSLWARTADAKQKKKKAAAPAGQRKLDTKEVIELSDEEEHEPEQRFVPGFSSDILAPPSSPAKEMPVAKRRAPKPAVRSSSPAFQTQNAVPVKSITKEKLSRSRDNAAAQRVRVNSPKTIATNSTAQSTTKPAGTAAASKPAPATATDLSVLDDRNSLSLSAKAAPPPQVPPDKAGQTLRMTARSSRKKSLLCQDQFKKKPSYASSITIKNNVTSGLDAASQDHQCSKPAGTQRRLLEERLARIRRTPNEEEEELPLDAADPGPTRLIERASAAIAPRGLPAQSVDNGTSLAELDRMIMPPFKSSAAERPSSVQPQSSRPRRVDSPPQVEPPPKQHRQLRKVVSDVTQPAAQKRNPGAPMRFTPSPSKPNESPAPAPQSRETEKPANATNMPPPPPKTRAKKPIQRSVSLNTTANVTSAVIFSKPFQTRTAPAQKAPEPQRAPNPWSREAFDLFTWRPPGWNEEKWSNGDGSETVTGP